MVYPYNGIVFGLKKEGNSDTCYHEDETWSHCAKWSKSDPKEQMLHDCTYMWCQLIESKSRKVEA